MDKFYASDMVNALRDIADNTSYLGEISDMIDKLCDNINDLNVSLEYINDRIGDLNEKLHI